MCLAVCIVPFVTTWLSQPYFEEEMSASNVTIVDVVIREPLMIVSICKENQRDKFLLQMIAYLVHIVINLVCNILCVVLYAIVFYKYFSLRKLTSANKSKGQKGELSLVCIGAMIFAVNVLFTVYGLLTIVAILTGGYTDA